MTRVYLRAKSIETNGNQMLQKSGYNRNRSNEKQQTRLKRILKIDVKKNPRFEYRFLRLHCEPTEPLY